MAEDKKKLALAILAKVKPAKKEEEESAEDDSGAEAAAGELKSALESGDSAEILSAFKALLDIC